MKQIVKLEPVSEDAGEGISQAITAAYQRSMLQESEQPVKGSWYEQECQLLECVAHGDPEGCARFAAQQKVTPRIGFSVSDRVLGARYLLVITVSIVARAAIRGGLPESEAFGLSDAYLQKSAELTGVDGLHALTATLVSDYARRVQRVRSAPHYCAAVSYCCNYLEENPHGKLSLQALAEQCGLSGGYLSRLFRQETGCTITAYALQKKLDSAAYLLRTTGHPVAEIAAFLGFASHSRFSEAFKKHYGKSPTAYREQREAACGAERK